MQSKAITPILKELGVENVNAGIVAMARLITNHRKLEFVLASESPELKQAVYDAVRPHLTFEARPLDTYIAGAGQRAEREQLPSLNEAGNIVPFRAGEDAATKQKRADQVKANIAEELARNTLMLNCATCGASQTFIRAWNENSTAVVRRARECGWVYDFKAETMRELCPECAVAI